MKFDFKKVSSSIIVILSLLVMFSFNATARAATLNFDVNGIGSHMGKNGYFELSIKGKKEYALPVQITNTSEKTITIYVERLNGLTSINGDRQYVPKEKLPYSSLTDKRYAMAKYLTGPSSITLKKGEKKVVQFRFKTPSKTQGTMVGGLAFWQKNGDQKVKTKGGKLTVFNRFERTIGIKADFSRVSPKIILEKPTVLIMPSIPNVLMNIRNDEPALINNMQINYDVSQNGKILFKGKKMVNMAPLTKTGFPIPWDYNTFAPGNYQLHMTISGVGKKTEKVYDFTIQEDKVSHYQTEISKKPVPVEKSNSEIFVGIILGVIIAGAAFFGYRIYLKRKKDDERFN